jgi:glycoside/pentoside/hexuronide:cation symporter, GPH family
MEAEMELRRGVRIGYSLGSLATGAFGTVPGLLLLPYLTDSLGVAAGLAGVLVLLPKAWDVLINPVVGRVSDRTVTRIGARRPYLLGGGLALAALFAAMFAGPFGTSSAAPWYVAIAFLACATAYAVFQVPYVAMPAEMTDDYAERTRLMTWRIAVLAVAILISGAVAPAIVGIGHDAIAGHRLMGVFVGSLIAIGATGAFLGTRRAPVGRVLPSEPSLRAQIAVATANRPFRALLVCFVVQAAGIATMLAGVKYFATHVLHDAKGGPTYLFAAFVGPALLVMPLWSRFTDKIRGYVYAGLLFAAGALVIGLLALVHAPAALAYAATAIVGAGYAGQQVFGLAMLPDCIAFDAARTGRRQAGVFTGLWTAGETLGLALGPGVFALLLQLGGYVSSKGDEVVAQPSAARAAIVFGFTAVPAVVVASALLLMRSYDLTPERLGRVDA